MHRADNSYMSGIIRKPSTIGVGGSPDVSVLLQAQPATPETLARGINKLLGEEPFRLYTDGNAYCGRNRNDLGKSDVREDERGELIWTTPFDDYLAGRFSYPRFSRLFDFLRGSADQKQLRIAEFQPGEFLDSALFFASQGCCVDLYEDVLSAISQLESLREKTSTPIREHITINPEHNNGSAGRRYDVALCVAPWPGHPIHLTNLLDNCVLRGGFAVVYTECDVYASKQEWLPIYNRTPDGMVMASGQFYPLSALAVFRQI